MSIAETQARACTIGEADSPAGDLARNRTFGPGRARPLLPRLDAAGRMIRKACLRQLEREKNGEALPPEIKWLTENYRFIETQIRQVRKLLPQIQREELQAGDWR